ncbi:hypothetical protein DPMN_154910 [Dreissena polymorpha]|uniref:Uncharacterized protein n=2 Tax=Dreissena polymorpha TaxID=45954 RepID=A0A9D4FLY7_DREPO|nr:hypothetical protein DPMN_154910 [Dreissena polymorpha]
MAELLSFISGAASIPPVAFKSRLRYISICKKTEWPVFHMHQHVLWTCGCLEDRHPRAYLPFY